MFWVTLVLTTGKLRHAGPFPSLIAAETYGGQAVSSGKATAFHLTTLAT